MLPSSQCAIPQHSPSVCPVLSECCQPLLIQCQADPLPKSRNGRPRRVPIICRATVLSKNSLFFPYTSGLTAPVHGASTSLSPSGRRTNKILVVLQSKTFSQSAKWPHPIIHFSTVTKTLDIVNQRKGTPPKRHSSTAALVHK